MKLTVVVEGQRFNVACGTGTQDIKWLALTATTLYGMKVRNDFTRGNLRQREQVNESAGSYVPSDVTTEDGTSLDPGLKLSDATTPDMVLRVHLQKSLAFGKDGYPLPTPWAVHAFSSNKQLRNLTQQHIDATQGAEQETKQQDEVARKEAAARIFGAYDDDMAITFEQDWNKIDIKISGGATIIAQGTALNDLKATVARYFEELVQLFRDFSGFSAGETTVISFTEFAHFVHRTGIYDVIRDQAVIKKIFKEADFEPIVDELNPDGAFSRTEFVEAVVRLAVLKYGGTHDLSLVEPCEAFEKVMFQDLLPYLQRNAQSAINEALNHSEFQVLCYDNFNKLQGVFYKYCSMDKSQDQKAHQLGTMNIHEFHQLLEDSSLIVVSGGMRKKNRQRNAGRRQRRGGQPGKGGAFRENKEQNKNAKAAFAEAQQVVKDSEMRELNELTYPEFIEALLRFGIHLKADEKKGSHNPQVTLLEKLEMFTTTIHSIATLSSAE